mmetsp:Transcript_41525/g.109530  ORF Transcript_41525/g.109530 Transcript_41525/m.109530 type:complete len:551 (-) Transcript_41525:36-1688(-)
MAASRVAAWALRAAAIAWCGCCPGVRAEEGKARTKNYPYEDLLSESVLYCYHKIIKNTSCCMDQNYAPGVERHRIRRPGTEWWCGKTCWDDASGPRGDDALWIPQSATCESPRVLWVHGGSWEYGSPFTDSYGQLASKIAYLAEAIVMVVDFPLAPEGNYSVIMDSVLEGLRWLAGAKLGDLNCRSAKYHNAPLFVGGDSAGGGTALSLVLKLKLAAGWAPGVVEQSHPDILPQGQLLAGAVFFSPWTNLRCDSPDYYFNSFAKIVGAADDVYVGDIMFRGHPHQNLDEFTANAHVYVGKNASLLTDPVASPFYAGERELGGGGIPPLYFAVGGSESILGDSSIFAQKAALYGVDVKVDVMVGMWHDFPMYSEGCGGGTELWQGVRALNQTGQFIKRISAAKRMASKFGLLWPPSRYHPGTPETSYVYDLTREDTREWYPRKLDEVSIAMGYDGLASAPPGYRGGGGADATDGTGSGAGAGTAGGAAPPAVATSVLAAVAAASAFGGALGALALQAAVPLVSGRWLRRCCCSGRGCCTERGRLRDPLLGA